MVTACFMALPQYLHLMAKQNQLILQRRYLYSGDKLNLVLYATSRSYSAILWHICSNQDIWRQKERQMMLGNTTVKKKVTRYYL
jgi:hypothetical protein